MTLTIAQARELAAQVVAMCAPDGADAIVTSGSDALTRFAGDRIHQNVAVEDTTVSVRVAAGKRQGGASTNRLDHPSLSAMCAAARAAAANAPDDPSFRGLPEPAEWVRADRARASAVAFGPRERAQAAALLIAPSATEGCGRLSAAGTVQVSRQVLAIASSRGVDAFAETTGLSATVLSTSTGGGTGWASFAGAGSEGFDPEGLGRRAAELALAGDGPEPLAPGVYTVVLGPEAVGEMLAMVAYEGLSAKSLAEARSFMSDALGEQVMSAQVTLADDALSSEAIGPTFDYEGMPKRRVAMVDAGVARAAVTDSYWAARLRTTNTGHALPAPNAFGPYPVDLGLEPGTASLEELIAKVDRGVFVNRFWYVNVEDPRRVELTGMTRDGTFLIENGRLTTALRNQRFTQSAVDALRSVRGVTRERQRVGEPGETVLAPAVLIDGFSFTGQTE